MGGAERAENKRKRQAAQPVTAATGSGGASRAVVAGVTIAVVLAVVGVGLFLQNRNPDPLPAAIPVAAAGPESPVIVQGTTVVTGSPEAPVTIHIYEDFLCPGCGQFEKLYHQRLAQAAADGAAKLVYHPVAILDHLSEPAGYSARAAGATFCAAEAGIFPQFHDSLFASQPSEGGPGWTTAQLQQLGRDLGAGDTFARCVQVGAEQRIVAGTDSARQYISGLHPDGQFGTPAVVVNDALVDTNDPAWLDKTLSAAAQP